MKKKLLITMLVIGVVSALSFLVLRSTVALEDRVCSRVAKQYGDCQKIIFVDAKANLVFTESEVGIIPVLTNNHFTKILKILPPLYIAEYKEHNQPVSWQAENHIREDFSLLSGYANDDAKTIIVHSEGDIQPNRFLVRDELWVWYATFAKNGLVLPAQVSAYNEDGEIVYDGTDEE